MKPLRRKLIARNFRSSVSSPEILDSISVRRREDDSQLEIEKRKLEIRELRRSHWTRPSTLIPLLATLGTLVFSSYIGVFDVAQRRLEIQNKEIQLNNESLTRQREELRRDIEALSKSQSQLISQKTELAQQKALLEATIEKLVATANSVEARRRFADRQLEISNRQFDETYSVIRIDIFGKFIEYLHRTCNRGYSRAQPLFFEIDTTANSRLPKSTSMEISGDVAKCFAIALSEFDSIKKLNLKDKEWLERRLLYASTLIGHLREEISRLYTDEETPTESKEIMTARKWTQSKYPNSKPSDPERLAYYQTTLQGFLRSYETYVIGSIASENWQLSK